MAKRNLEEAARVRQQYKLDFEDCTERERWHLQFCLNTSPTYFFVWLKDKISDVVAKLRSFPVGDGELEPDFLKSEVEDHIIRMWVPATFAIREPTAVGLRLVEHPFGSVMFIKAVPLASERAQIEMVLYTPHLLSLYKELLTDICACWPEAQQDDALALLMLRQVLASDRSQSTSSPFSESVSSH